jgi:hypothetical protein
MPGQSMKLARKILALAALAAAGCGGPAVVPVDTSVMPELVATGTELAQVVVERADSIRGIKADLDMYFRRSPEEKRKGCRGKLVSIKKTGGTSSIYLKGYKRLIPTFFTLTSDGREFWLHIPSDNVVYTGPFDRTEKADTAEVDLEAADLSRLLYVEPFDTSQIDGLEEESGRFVLTLADGGLPRRRLWIDKKIFAVVREKYYNPVGKEDLELRRTKFASAGGVFYPLEMTIIKPESGREITLTVRELELNPEGIPSEAFRFEFPRGSNVIRLNKGGEQ